MRRKTRAASASCTHKVARLKQQLKAKSSVAPSMAIATDLAQEMSNRRSSTSSTSNGPALPTAARRYHRRRAAVAPAGSLPTAARRHQWHIIVVEQQWLQQGSDTSSSEPTQSKRCSTSMSRRIALILSTRRLASDSKDGSICSRLQHVSQDRR